jgi:hypothetical protein
MAKRHFRSKADIARENGRKSNGPITPQGKAKSSRNALRHGYTSHKAVLISTESEEQLREFSETYFDRYLPADAAEALLVEEVIACAWRLRRLWHAESSLLDLELARLKAYPCPFEPVDPEMRTTLALQVITGSTVLCAADHTISGMNLPEAPTANQTGGEYTRTPATGGQLQLLQRYARSLRLQQSMALRELLQLQSLRTTGDQPNEPTGGLHPDQPQPAPSADNSNPQPKPQQPLTPTEPPAATAQRRNLVFFPASPAPQPPQVHKIATTA